MTDDGYRIIENPQLKAKGAKWWHSQDYASPNLTKASMGDFFYHVLSAGGQIGTVWPFQTSKGASVYITVFMTDEAKERIESNCRYRFKPPPKLHLNSDAA